MKTSQIQRLLNFADVHPELVRGASRVDFHRDYIELIWPKLDYTPEELQAVAKKHKHLEWNIATSRSGGLHLDWFCDFGDVQVSLEAADVARLVPRPSKVDFDATSLEEADKFAARLWEPTVAEKKLHAIPKSVFKQIQKP